MSVDEFLCPREAGKYISQNAKHVKINDSGVKKLAKKLLQCFKNNEFNIKSWKSHHELNPQTMDESAINWIFVVDTLNFNFWCEDQSKRFLVKYKGKEYTGYWSLCAVIDRALDESIPITDPKFYSKITHEQLVHIFRSDSPYSIPLIDERLKVLHEAGQKLLEDFDGSFVNLLKLCDNSAEKLLKKVVDTFESYRDTATFNEKQVAIYKRAQILIADIWACFEGEGLGKFKDIDTITMFADYRIPQVLVYFDVLEYSNELMEHLKNGKVFKSGDPLEVEIRGCSIEAVELLARELSTIAQNTMNAIMIDHYLWDYRRENATLISHIPFHRIRCIYY